MLNLGWSEIFFIMILSIIVIGPKEVPTIMYNLGRIARRLYYIRFAMSQQFEDFLKEHDLHELKNIGNEVNFEAGRHSGAGFNEAEDDEAEALFTPPVPEVKHDA